MANFVSFSNAQDLFGKVGTKLDALTGALTFRGSLTFANLPGTLTKAMAGYVYNVTDAFTTDSRFVEGTGKKFPAGTDVSVADLSTFDAVTPVGSENPTTEGWYEYNSTTGKYFLSEDTEVDNEKTYYAYNEVIKFNIGVGFIDVEGINTRIDNAVSNFADAFDATAAYNTGDVVIYNDKLYKFKANHAAGAWVGTDADAITVEDLIDAAESDSLTQAQVQALLALLD